MYQRRQPRAMKLDVLGLPRSFRFGERPEDGKKEDERKEGVPSTIFDPKEKGFHSVSLVLGRGGFGQYFGSC